MAEAGPTEPSLAGPGVQDIGIPAQKVDEYDDVQPDGDGMEKQNDPEDEENESESSVLTRRRSLTRQKHIQGSADVAESCHDGQINGAVKTEGTSVGITGEETNDGNTIESRVTQENRTDVKDMEVQDVPNAEAEAGTEEYEGDLEGDPGTLNGFDRDRLFEKGREFGKKGKKDIALKYFLKCLTGLEESNKFSYLPQCLHGVADIYYEKEEYDKAVQFIQAEKMYYETALIDTAQLQKKLEETKRRRSVDEGQGVDMDEAAVNADMLRADEYEKLAHMCLDKKQPALALEYQGKATKLRQKAFGDSHPVTLKSLDFFTVLYGEVGKQQYSESIQKLRKTSSNDDDDDDAEENDEENEPPKLERQNSDDQPRPILRNRGGSVNNEDEKRHRERRLSQQVRFVEPSIARRQQEEWITRALLWILLFVSFVVLFLVLSLAYCRIDKDSLWCAQARADIHYYYMKVKYWYYRYTSPKDTYG